MSAAAASACCAVSATTSATWSASQRTTAAWGVLPVPQSTGWSGMISPYSLTGTSAAVSTASTPGAPRAASVCTARTRACATPAKTIFSHAWLGMSMSPGYWASARHLGQRIKTGRAAANCAHGVLVYPTSGGALRRPRPCVKSGCAMGLRVYFGRCYTGARDEQVLPARCPLLARQPNSAFQGEKDGRRSKESHHA